MNRQERRDAQRKARAGAGDASASGSADVDELEGEEAAASEGGSPRQRAIERDEASDEIDDLEADAEIRKRRERASAGTTYRFRPRQFLHEVTVEMRKVAWPTRAETINYSMVVFFTLAILMALIAGLDFGFNKLANFLFTA